MELGRARAPPLHTSLLTGPGHARTSLEEQMAILGWILFGLVVGALAKLVMPGRDPRRHHRHDAARHCRCGFRWIHRPALGWYGKGEAAGFMVSFLGAVLLLVLYRMFTRTANAQPVEPGR